MGNEICAGESSGPVLLRCVRVRVLLTIIFCEAIAWVQRRNYKMTTHTKSKKYSEEIGAHFEEDSHKISILWPRRRWRIFSFGWTQHDDIVSCWSLPYKKISLEPHDAWVRL